jgi:Ca-activated chloride channel family protein
VIRWRGKKHGCPTSVLTPSAFFVRIHLRNQEKRKEPKMKNHYLKRSVITIVVATLVAAACSYKETGEATATGGDNARPSLPLPMHEPADQSVRVPVGPFPDGTAERGIVEHDAAGRPELTQLHAKAADAVRMEHYRQAPATHAFVPLPVDHERYAHFDDNPLKLAAEEPVSTFSIDVDTGAYANVRRILTEGRLPPSDAVRVEEMINYFAYEDPLPARRGEPFRVTTEVGPNPWNPQTRLLRIGIRAWDQPADELPPANLVFLVDVSGSMRSPDKLPLLKQSLRLLTGRLDKDDSLSLVVYSGASGVVLEPTPGDEQAKILAAIDGLEAGGSTNGAAGIALAYAQARQAYMDRGINRVILATDGDFNVGTVNHEALVDLIKRERASGVSLTTLGFGGGNYNDRLMEQLADHGNGNHAYIDSLLEAQKVLVDEMGATLHTVARDVKIQIEFNPAVVREHRLVGYENRMLAREDFNNDRVDAGEIGAGHSVVALYELALVGDAGARVDPLRYGAKRPKGPANRNEIAFLRMRFKRPDHDDSELLEHPISTVDILRTLETTSDDYRFSAAVAAFGQRLRGGEFLEGFGYEAIEELARGARGRDDQGVRGDLQRLVRLAASLERREPGSAGKRSPAVSSTY